MSQANPSKKEQRLALLAEAQRVFGLNGGQPLSRDFFRRNSPLKDTWANHFSTFSDFMAAAKLPTIAHPPNPELSTEQQVEIERDKIRAKSEGMHAKFVSVAKKLDETERQLAILQGLDSRTPQEMVIQPKLPSGQSESVAVMVGSDWHIEENVTLEASSGNNVFNLAEGKKRATKFFQGGHRLQRMFARDTNVTTHNQALLGDFVNNMIHDDARDTNNLLPADAIAYAEDLLISGIRFLLKETDLRDIKVVCHSGNHGRMTAKQRNGEAEAGNSLERYMYHHLQRVFEDERRIEFQIAEGYHSFVHLFGGAFPIRFHHGHSIRYNGGVGGITIPVNKAINDWNKADNARNVKLDVFGHFHQYMDGGNFVCNGSLIGYNAFAVQIKASPERPTQSFFLVNKNHNAKSISAPIFLTDGSYIAKPASLFIE